MLAYLKVREEEAGQLVFLKLYCPTSQEITDIGKIFPDWSVTTQERKEKSFNSNISKD